MAPGRRKKGKGKSRKKTPSAKDLSPTSSVRGPPLQDDAVDSLVEQARSSVDPFAAVMLYEKALDARPDDTCIMGDAAELMLQLGRTEQAKQVLARSIALRPQEGPDQYLYMAQLHEGRQALGFYEKGMVLLQKQLENGVDGAKGEAASLKQRLCMAHCGVGELFLTDLCFEEDAEQRCQEALDQSMTYDYGGPEPLHALANLRLSQGRSKDAAQFAEEAFRRLRLCEPPPDQESRVSLAKILMECSAVENKCCDKALEILGGLMQEDDENVELWYLMAVAFNGLNPPDYESARCHLNTASEMLEKIRTAQKEAGEEFAFEEQVQLVEEQLNLVARAAEDDMESEEKGADKLHMSDKADAASIRDDETQMDCG